jgi:hypothetical protein
MALFGLFKSKSERDLDKAIREIHAKVFPNGDSDVDRDTARVNAITKGKLPHERVKGFTIACKTYYHITDEKDDVGQFVESNFRRADGKLSKDDAYEVYAYFAGEGSYIDNVTQFAQTNKLFDSESAFAKAIADARGLFAQGVYTDDLPTGYGEFGLTLTNPIPTLSALQSHFYLKRLRYAGKPVEAVRVGSFKSEVTAGSVDGYKINVDGKPVTTLYLCPYHKRNSRKAPRGFSLNPPASGVG